MLSLSLPSEVWRLRFDHAWQYTFSRLHVFDAILYATFHFSQRSFVNLQNYNTTTFHTSQPNHAAMLKHSTYRYRFSAAATDRPARSHQAELPGP